jgi:type II secretory pathway predicted ATPase ExeA
MFISYYSLKGAPFEKSIKREHMFCSSSLKEFSSRMEYMKQYRGILLLTGESGVGKTTALRSFVEDLKGEFYKPVYLPLATVSSYEFYIQINKALGGDDLFRKCSLFHSIQNLVMEYATVKKQIPVILFDEVHFLRNQNFYELQMLLNFNYDSLDPAIVVMCGHPYLRETLLRPAFSTINQRIRLKYEFLPLTESETIEYIRHNLKLVGGDPSIFNDNALSAIHSVSSGIMRIINNLATKALIYGASKCLDAITEETIYTTSPEL